MNEDELELKQLRSNRLFKNSLACQIDDKKLKNSFGFSDFGKRTAVESEEFRLPEQKLKLLKEETKNKKPNNESDEEIQQPTINSFIDTEDYSDDVSEDEEFVFPVRREVHLDHGTKVVSSIAVDPNGSRLLTGGYDGFVKIWDFAGMKNHRRPFEEIEPCESHQVQNLEFSMTGDRMLCVVANAQAQVYDRDGILLETCAKGDPYIKDKNHTKGHVGLLYGGRWHPIIWNWFLTYSIDGTVRVWDTEIMKKRQIQIYKVNTQAGKSTQVTSATFSHDGNLMIAGTNFGGIYAFKVSSGTNARPSITKYNCHEQNGFISSLAFSRDDRTLITRSFDNTMKIWDIRSFKNPINVFEDLENDFNDTSCIFSPNEEYILTGTSTEKGKRNGKLLIYDRKTFEKKYELDIPGVSATSLVWHPKLNQILVGCGNGKIKILFDPKRSVKGAKLLSSRVLRKAESIISDSAHPSIYTPNALPMFTDLPRAAIQLRKEKIRELKLDRVPTGDKAPDLTSKWHPFIKEMVKNDRTRIEDPREALLKYKEISESQPTFVSNAYKDTQPVTILAATVDSEDDEEV